MTDNENKQRRMEDRKPDQPLYWSDAQAEQSSTAGAARQGGNTNEFSESDIPADAPNAFAKRYSALLEENRKLKEQLAASVPPLTAPAPLTDELRKLVNAHCNDLLDCAAILHDDGRFKRTAEEIRTAVAELRAAMKAAPAPQQSELLGEALQVLQAVAHELSGTSFSQHKVREGNSDVWRYIGRGEEVARRVREVLAKAAPAVPVQSEKLDEIRGLLQEAYGFAAVSPRGKDNINAALDLLDELDVATPVQTAELAKKMREMRDVQGQNGAWDCDPYMHGMYNGMEYMLAMVENREPNFRSAPAKWLHKPVDMSAAAKDVLDERRRQVKAEGWNAEHDDAYTDGQLSMAAACYATQGHLQFPENWPWSMEWWKPAAERRNLVKACALIIADIERLDRDALIAPSTGEASKGDSV